MLTKARQRFFALLLGAALLVAALLLLLHNHWQDKQAKDSARRALVSLRLSISEKLADSADSGQPGKQESHASRVSGPMPMTDQAQPQAAAAMPVIEIEGNAYIGYLSIPVLDLELAILAACDQETLQLGPCRQFGTIRNDDMTIAGHNYDSHFGNLHLLQAGDRVIFTDLEGQAYSFNVAGQEVVAANAVEKVRNSGWDLTLYTCTYGGHQRLLVGCRAESK